jgi:hypothetical protein
MTASSDGRAAYLLRVALFLEAASCLMRLNSFSTSVVLVIKLANRRSHRFKLKLELSLLLMFRTFASTYAKVF